MASAGAGEVDSSAREQKKVLDSRHASQDEIHALEEAMHKYPVMSKATAITLVAALSSAMMLNILLVVGANIAIPSMGEDLGIETSNLQWLVSAYSLSFGSLLLLFGRLGDLHGHRLVFLSGMTWLGIWSLVIGFAPNEISVDIMRALQGAGAAAAIPSALGIIGRSFPPGEAKSLAMGTFSGAAPLGAAFGNVVAGVFCEYTAPGWRALFWLAAGMAAVIVVAGFFAIPKEIKHVPLAGAAPEDRRVDWIGAALVVAGLTLLTFALADSQSAPNGWRTPYIPALLAVGVVLLVIFWFFEQRMESQGRIPLMSTRIWFKHNFAIIQLVASLTWMCFATWQYLATLYYQEYLRLNPIETTLRFLPMAVVGMSINFLVALVAARVPGQCLMIIGCAGCSLAPVLFAIQKVSATFWSYQFVAMLLSVFGADFIFCAGIMYISQTAHKKEQGMASGLFNTTMQVGTAIGLAIMTIIQVKITARDTARAGIVFDQNAGTTPPEAFLQGLRAAFWGCAAFEFVALALSVFALRGMGYVGHRDAKHAPEDALESASDKPLPRDKAEEL